MKFEIKDIIPALFLAIFALQIPTVSTFAILCLGSFYGLQNFSLIIKKDLLQLILLALFLISYVTISLYYGLLDERGAITIFILLFSSYLFSLYCDQQKDSLIFIIISFSVLFVCLSIITTFNFIPSLLIMERGLFNFWTGAEVNSPLLGLFLALGAILSIFLAKKDFSTSQKILFSIILIICIVGLIIFKGRGPFLAIFFCFFLLWLLSKNKIKNLRAPVVVLLTSSPIIFTALLYYSADLDFFFTSYTDRLDQEGFDSDRYRRWLLALENFFNYPLGGKQFMISKFGEGYVHNTWLDVHYETGIIPLIFLFSFYLCAMPFIHWKKIFIFSKSYSLIPFFLLILICLQFEPVIQGSTIFFAIHMMSIGFLINESRKLR